MVTAFAAIVVAAVESDGVGRVAVAVILVVGANATAWWGVMHRETARQTGLLVAAVLLIATAITMASAVALAVAILVAGSALSAQYSLGRDRRTMRSTPPPGRPVAAAEHPVVLVNPSSGDDDDSRELQDEARRRGIEMRVLDRDDDLQALAAHFIDEGADAIGMAGGDGSQACVAQVAMNHDVAFVCIPSGTRNHFALDLGLERDDVVGALDAFGDDAVERRVDVATVGDRVFVNNACMGIYAEIVQSPDYRDAKVKAITGLLQQRYADDHDEATSTLRFTTPDGTTANAAPLVLVSNNQYELGRFTGFGSRPRLDAGRLGIAVVDGSGGGLVQWTDVDFTVDADGEVEVALDGEGLTLDAPLRFRSCPQALRVRIPRHAPGRSPAAQAAPSLGHAIVAVVRTAFGVHVPSGT